MEAKRKLPILISLGGGQLGRFIKKEIIGEGDLVNIYYHPYGLFGMFQTSVIRNVPDSAVIEISGIPGAGQDGIPKEGYVFLLVGENGNRYLSKKLNLFLDKNIEHIEMELRKQRIKEKSYRSEQIKSASGIKEELRELAERNKIISKAGDKSTSPWRRRLFDEDLR